MLYRLFFLKKMNPKLTGTCLNDNKISIKQVMDQKICILAFFFFIIKYLLKKNDIRIIKVQTKKL